MFDQNDELLENFTLPSDSTLTLYIPDLFGFQSTFSQLSQEELSQLPFTQFPVLEKWLSRGAINKNENDSEILSSEFGLKTVNNDKPYAALSLLAEDSKDVNAKQHYWLRADPVYLYADRDTVLLSAHEEIALTQDEADKLVEVINSHFKDEPWTLYTLAPHRWYFALEKSADLVTHPLHDVMGRNIHHYTVAGEDAGYWQTITNEIQMLLHGTTVNFERESTNQYPVNSLWLWGGGSLPELKEINGKHEVVISNDILYTGVGKYCGLDVFSLDNNLVNYIQKTNSFVVLDMLSEHIKTLDLYRFMQTLADMEKNILEQCNKLLLDGKINKVVLIIDDATTVTVTKKLLRRWWKRTKSFVKFNYA